MAAQKALAMAGRKVEDIDLAEVHDCFTIAEIMVIEALGLVEKGQGGRGRRGGPDRPRRADSRSTRAAA